MTKRSTKVPTSQFLPANALAQVTGGGGEPVKTPTMLTFKWQPESIEYTKPSG